MNYKTNCYRGLILSALGILSSGNAHAIMDGFLSGFSSFNDIAQGVGNFIKSDTGQSVFKVVDSVGNLAKNKAKSDKERREAEEKKKEYFKETDFYINKDGILCIFRGGQLMALGKKKLATNTLLENNIYILNGKNFIYTTKDAIEPTVGHFKLINFEEGKFYYKNGLLYQFVDGALQQYDVETDNMTDEQSLVTEISNEHVNERANAENSLPIVLTNTIRTKNTPKVATSHPAKTVNQALPIQSKVAIKRLKTIENILETQAKCLARTSILNIGKINICSTSETEYNFILKKIINLKKASPASIKSIIIFASGLNKNNLNRYNTFKSFCAKNNIRLFAITRGKIQNYISEKFNTTTNNINLTACDISDLNRNEVLFLRCCAIEFLMKYFNNNSIVKKKILLSLKAIKNSESKETNLQIIKDFANVYKKFVSIKIINSLGGVTLL